MNFEDFLTSLSNLQRIAPRDDLEMRAIISVVVYELSKLDEINRDTLARFFERFPESVPILCTAAGLGQEQLKNQLKHKLKTQGWITLARRDADRLVSFLDQEYQIVKHIRNEWNKTWTYKEVLLERHLWSRSSGAQSVGRGKRVEDEVERVVKELQLPYEMRTRFIGRKGETAPCDLAIPGGGGDAMIVIGIKGFNSTGSKLTDAVGEIERMASVRLPRQFVYAVVDGIGWLSRQADLKRIFSLREQNEIDGLYTLKHMELFKQDILAAAKRIGIVN